MFRVGATGMHKFHLCVWFVNSINNSGPVAMSSQFFRYESINLYTYTHPH